MKFIHTIKEHYKASKIKSTLNESTDTQTPEQADTVKSVLSTLTNGLDLDVADSKSVSDDGIISIELTINDDGTDTVISLEDLADIIETAIDAAVAADEVADDNEDESTHTIVVDVIDDEDINVDDYMEDEETEDDTELDANKISFTDKL